MNHDNSRSRFFVATFVKEDLQRFAVNFGNMGEDFDKDAYWKSWDPTYCEPELEMPKTSSAKYLQEFSGNTTHSFTSLLVVSSRLVGERNDLTRDFDLFGLLVLVDSPGSPGSYERFDFLNMSYFGDFEKISNDKAKIGPLVFDFKTILLR